MNSKGSKVGKDQEAEMSKLQRMEVFLKEETTHSEAISKVDIKKTLATAYAIMAV